MDKEERNWVALATKSKFILRAWLRPILMELCYLN
jgi:hypothetical protein